MSQPFPSRRKGLGSSSCAWLVFPSEVFSPWHLLTARSTGYWQSYCVCSLGNLRCTALLPPSVPSGICEQGRRPPQRGEQPYGARIPKEPGDLNVVWEDKGELSRGHCGETLNREVGQGSHGLRCCAEDLRSYPNRQGGYVQTLRKGVTSLDMHFGNAAL